MTVIRVDDDVWRWLQSKAEPLEDTPNSVLRRVAGLEARKRGSIEYSPKAAAPHIPLAVERKTQQSQFRAPILRILARHNGKGARMLVLKEVERAMVAQLTEYDRSDINSGTLRWQKSAEWEVSAMRSEGLLLPQSASPRGVWRLSAAGEREAERLSRKDDSIG